MAPSLFKSLGKFLPVSTLLLAIFCVHAEASYVRVHNDESTNYISPEHRATCRETLSSPSVEASGRCYRFALCILDSLDNYALAGANSGTTLLALIPPALTVFATGHMQERSLLHSGFLRRYKTRTAPQRLEIIVLIIIAAFSGAYSPGIALRKVAIALHSAKRSMQDQRQLMDEITMNQTQDTEDVQAILFPSKNFQALRSRIPIYIVLTSAMAATLYVWCIIGFRTVVTWACNWDILVVMWALFRCCPLLFESLLLIIVYKQLDKKLMIRRNVYHQPGISLEPRPDDQQIREPIAKQSMVDDDNDTAMATDPRSDSALGWPSYNVSSTMIRLISLAHIAIRILDFGLILLGTGILGSAILMDGGDALYYLVAVPMLYGLLNVCCRLLEYAD